MLAQLAGVTFFLPMLIASWTVGWLTDWMNSLRLCRLVLGWSIGAVAVVVLQTSLAAGFRPWVTYAAMFSLGLGAVVNQVSRRTLVFSMVPPSLATTAMTLDALSQFTAAAVGPLVAAAATAAVGAPGGYSAILMALLLALGALFWRSRPFEAVSCEMEAAKPQRGRESTHPAGPVALTRRLRERVPCSSTLRSIVGVTVVMNLFLFPYAPLIPVLALDLNASTLMAGVLTTAQGIGMTLGGLGVLVTVMRHRGQVYVAGSLFAMLGLTTLGTVRVPMWGFLLLLGIGLGAAGFGTMQSVLVLSAAQQGGQGRAMGLLSTAIGVLPMGSLQIGIVADQIGASSTLFAEGCAGIGCLALWLLRYPQVLRVT